jgi:hypothetical protein
MPGEISGAGAGVVFGGVGISARIVRRFYRGSFLGCSVTTRTVHSRNGTRCSGTTSDLFCGTQDYTTLKQRVLEHLGGTPLSQFVSSVLNFDRPAAKVRTYPAAD